jgi:hypothetical protein
LLKITKQTDLDVQREAFEQLLEGILARGGNRPSKLRLPPAKATRTASAPVRVRGVVYFNPEMFVDQRRSAQRSLEDIEDFKYKLNQRLQSSRSKLTRAKVLAEVHRKLKACDMIEAYDVDIDENNGKLAVRMKLNEGNWASRRRYDGFSFLVAHPEMQNSAEALCRLYRAKDTVEKDFETIKSFVELRPVRHHLDGKVRAHVTICMLALLLERSLREKLGNITAQRALEELGTIHLNRYRSNGETAVYDVTELNADQRAILRKLRLQQLADDYEVLDRITPR